MSTQPHDPNARFPRRPAHEERGSHQPTHATTMSPVPLAINPLVPYSDRELQRDNLIFAVQMGLHHDPRWTHAVRRYLTDHNLKGL